MNKKLNFWIDMDGVLSKFEEKFQGVYGVDSMELRKNLLDLNYDIGKSSQEKIVNQFDDLFWRMIAMIPYFWENLSPYRQQVNDLNNFMKDFPEHSYQIISSTPAVWYERDRAMEQKNNWIDKYFNKELKRYFPVVEYFGHDVKSPLLFRK